MKRILSRPLAFIEEKKTSYETCLFIGLLLIIVGCDKDKDGTGTVSFGSNYYLMNCIVESALFVDGELIGSLPGNCDSIVDCASDLTLNLEVSEGDHSYEIIISNQDGSCFADTSGVFAVGKDECIKIHFDILEMIVEEPNEISGEFVLNNMVCYPDDSIFLEFEVFFSAEKEPFTYQWIYPDTFSGTGPFTVGLREDLLLDVLITDAENEQFEYIHLIRKDTIDPLNYDYRESYSGDYDCEIVDYQNHVVPHVYIHSRDTIAVTRDDDFSRIIVVGYSLKFDIRYGYIGGDKQFGRFYKGDSLYLDTYFSPEPMEVRLYYGKKIEYDR